MVQVLHGTVVDIYNVFYEYLVRSKSNWYSSIISYSHLRKKKILILKLKNVLILFCDITYILSDYNNLSQKEPREGNCPYLSPMGMPLLKRNMKLILLLKKTNIFYHTIQHIIQNTYYIARYKTLYTQLLNYKTNKIVCHYVLFLKHILP